MMEQMILGQILNRLNTLDESMRIIAFRKEAAPQEQGETDDADKLATEVREMKTAMESLKKEIDRLILQSEQMEKGLTTLLLLVPELKCRFDGRKAELKRNDKRIKEI